MAFLVACTCACASLALSRRELDMDGWMDGWMDLITPSCVSGHGMCAHLSPLIHSTHTSIHPFRTRTRRKYKSHAAFVPNAAADLVIDAFKRKTSCQQEKLSAFDLRRKDVWNFYNTNLNLCNSSSKMKIYFGIHGV
jgi:hypothetical protein